MRPPHQISFQMSKEITKEKQIYSIDIAKNSSSRGHHTSLCMCQIAAIVLGNDRHCKRNEEKTRRVFYISVSVDYTNMYIYFFTSLNIHVRLSEAFYVWQTERLH